MSALRILYIACTTVLAGVEVVVLDAVPSPVHDDLLTAETLTAGALAVGLGVAFALGAAFVSGLDRQQRRGRDIEQAARDAVDAAFAAGFAYAQQVAADARREADAAATTLVDLDAHDAVAEPTPADRRNWTIADHWAHHDATGEQAAVSDDTHLMLFGELAELLAEPEPEPVDVPPSQRNYTIVTTHLRGVAAQLASPAAWDTWRWESAA